MPRCVILTMMSPSRGARLGGRGLLLLVAASGWARAQQVSGVVVDSTTAAPVSGAVVQLLDSAGRAVARTIADRTGRYRLTTVGTATRLQAIRIGYRPRELRVDPSAANDDVRILMHRLPIELEPVHVVDDRNCPDRKDRGEALALWDEARAGLLATIVARESKPGSITSAVFERRLTGNGRSIEHQQVQRVSAETARPFVAGRDSGFAALGFMDESGTDRIYQAPDADVLLDPQFGATHCFSLAKADRDHPGQTGLAFEPARGRESLVEITGVLWIDRAAAALKSLQFRF